MSVCKENIFKEVFQKWNEPLQRYAASRGMKYDSIPDLVQESFLRLWKNCQKVSAESAGAFLFKTISNLNVDLFRKDKVRLSYKSSLTNQNEMIDGQYSLEMKEFQEQLSKAISSMTDASKEVFILHRFDGKSYKEIADIYEISVKAVEKRMHKALLHLAKMKINLKKR